MTSLSQSNKDDTNDDADALFESALAALYSSKHQSSTPEALKASAARRTRTVTDMRQYCRRISLQFRGNIKVIHIAGTKGKGSTACLCESILRTVHHYQTGLFTSPHLVDIRERIRIQGQPVSKAAFGKAYWTIRKRLEAHNQDDDDDLPVLPGYFRMLTLLAMFIFTHYSPTLDVIVLEVGMGGRYDATNAWDWPHQTSARGVTKLDFDHVRVLGHRLEQIAWEKGGIFLQNKCPDEDSAASPRPLDDGSNDPIYQDNDGDDTGRTEPYFKYEYFALEPNSSSVAAVLQQCAQVDGQGRRVCFVAGPSRPQRLLPPDTVLGLAGRHQKDNAELAIALCQSIVASNPNNNDDDDTKTNEDDMPLMQKALEQASWLGRCQTIEWNDATTLRLDGAHTMESVAVGLEWFQRATSSSSHRYLLFHCSHERNPFELLSQFVKIGFDAVYFCPTDSHRPSPVQPPTAREILVENGVSPFSLTQHEESVESTWHDTLALIWKQLQGLQQEQQRQSSPVSPARSVKANLTVSSALADIVNHTTSSNEGGVGKREILIAGSLYLVGSALTAIQWNEADAEGELVIQDERSS